MPLRGKNPTGQRSFQKAEGRRAYTDDFGKRIRRYEGAGQGLPSRREVERQPSQTSLCEQRARRKGAKHSSIYNTTRRQTGKNSKTQGVFQIENNSLNKALRRQHTKKRREKKTPLTELKKGGVAAS